MRTEANENNGESHKDASEYVTGVEKSFTFTGCYYSVSSYDGHRGRACYICRNGIPTYLLSNIDGIIPEGKSVAIMGPSGSGKTTLLNTLTLAPTRGISTGSVVLNGEALTPNLFRQHCAYVPQNDHLFPFLTCRENISFAVDFLMGSLSKGEKNEQVDKLIQDLGLGTCQHVLCGNQFVKGLSGGQKRRLSLASALSKQATVLFLDEPTSGLDAAATAEVVAVLQRIQASRGVTVICTIHQPSSRVFSKFDFVLLLSGGKVVYFGPMSEVADYFHHLGHDAPPGVSLSEFILDLVNSDFGGAEQRAQVESLKQAWTRNARASASEPPAPLPQGANPPGTRLLRIFLERFASDLQVHLRRLSVLSVRDPTLYLSRMVINLVGGVLFAVVYLGARERNQEQVTNRMFLTAWLVSVPSCMGIIAVYCYNQEFQSVRREVRDGMYSAPSYLLARALMQIPFMVLLALSSLSIGAYAIANFRPEGFGRMLAAFSAAMWAFEMIAQAYGVAFGNPLVGMLAFNLTWFTAFLFAGFLVVSESIPWPLRALLYTSPLRWSIAAMVKAEFSGAEFAGARLVESGGGANSNGSVSLATAFVCDIPPTARQVENQLTMSVGTTVFRLSAGLIVALIQQFDPLLERAHFMTE
jgi:ABC-type multidrug transport system ATPase subunit